MGEVGIGAIFKVVRIGFLLSYLFTMFLLPALRAKVFLKILLLRMTRKAH